MYTSPYKKLFIDVRTGSRGRPAGDLNIKLQVGLSHSMIFNTAMQWILATASIPPPLANAMQYQANKIGDNIVNFNQNEMKYLRKKFRI